jgi:hypothetical protein
MQSYSAFSSAYGDRSWWPASAAPSTRSPTFQEQQMNIHAAYLQWKTLNDALMSNTYILRTGAVHPKDGVLFFYCRDAMDFSILRLIAHI